MHKKFNHEEIEKKWQAHWKESGIYTVGDRDTAKEKEYVLVEWPYPSGNLHVGHWYAFAVVDIYVRARRMQGKQVLFPIGFDAFGLPAENAAIKHGLDPKAWTESNIAYMREQLESMGNAFSWDKTTSSTDPEYYKWTQWMFTQFFEHDIAYRGSGVVNWCPGCNTVIANEQVTSSNTCERSGDAIEKREMPQWMLRITQYADRLIDDLNTLKWPEYIKEAQRQWIGRSKGAELTFTLSTGDLVSVFTTRPDTLYGVTYLVLAPDHELVIKNKDSISNREVVSAYAHETSQKDDLARTKIEKEKTGIKLEGITAVHPTTGEEIPVFVADYVLKGYGTGAIMAVPAHDERDFAFATKFNLPITQVVISCADDSKNPPKDGFAMVTRDTVIVYLKNNETKKYAVLNWHGTLEGVVTGIMGGIEEGQTAEEAVLNEISEETGITGVTISKKLQWITAARYCASHKGVNRCAISHVYLAEVENLTTQAEISDGEAKIHTLQWVPESEVLSRLTPYHQKQIWSLLKNETALTGSGFLMNSGEFDGMSSEEAGEAIVKKVGGKMTNTYRLRDWSIGRQRYWGVPIPIVYNPAGKAHIVPKEHLPWLLPTDVDFRPTGVAPLAKSNELKERTERIFGTGWTPEVETMDTFVDSSWYFLRYLDTHNTESLSSREAQEKWMPVDLYFGGSEHTTMHVLYSRFWHKALLDLGLVTTHEPYKMRLNRGLVLGPDGNKMSKSKGNVIDPDAQVKLLGADAVKMFLAFMGPYGEPTNYPWSLDGLVGLRRFLERVYGLSEHIIENESEETLRLLNKTIVKVSKDIEVYKFNTAISALMIFINHAEKSGLSNESYGVFLQLLAPFAPHITEELWSAHDKQGSVHEATWPVAHTALLENEDITLAVQINGKMRGTIHVPAHADESEVLKIAEVDTEIGPKIRGERVRVIYVPNRVLNIVTTQ
jgi:leucyl-tRNA synthetase